MNEGTYQQKGTLYLAAFCLLAMIGMYMFKGSGEQTKEIEIGIAGAFSVCVMAFIKASSDAKNDSQMQRLTDSHSELVKEMTTGLINSTPTPPTPPMPVPQVIEIVKLNWLGSFPAAPRARLDNDAYVNTTDGKNYYWNNNTWIETTQKP